jgi:hypothetical protein
MGALYGKHHCRCVWRSQHGLKQFLCGKTRWWAIPTWANQLAAASDRLEQRLGQFEALLRSLVKTLRSRLPEEEIKGVYEPGHEYDFYRDLSSLFAATTQEIFIIDAYLAEEIFNLYVSKVNDAATVRILSNRIGTNVETVAKKYASSRPLELRTTADVHDRMVFFDQRGWVIGQSIKDAARKSPLT